MISPRTLGFTTASLLATIALAACGSSSHSNSNASSAASSGSGTSTGSASSASATSSSSSSTSSSAGSSTTSGGDNGVATKSADQIVSAAQHAAQAAKTVHVSGAVTSGGKQISLDLHLVSGQGGQGSIALSGANIQLVTIKSTVYLKASQRFWSLVGNAQVGQLLKDRWLKAPSNSGVSSFNQFTDLHQLFTQLLSSHGKLSKGTKTTVAGQSVIGVKDSTQGGTLYVATTGQPYPVQVSKPGGGGSVTFDHYNDPISLSAPAGAVDASQLSK
jgi:hypothetical protein